MRFVNEWKRLFLILAVFLAFFWLPLDLWDPEGRGRILSSVYEALALTKSYAREHVVLCLLPAFFIAGAIASFLSQASVIKYLGAKAKKIVAYPVASVSGSVLAVCSCTVLPLFAGIYSRGAGLGPVSAFLYAGPAVNVLAIILTARVLGPQIGIARAVGAVVFSVVIGLLMHFIFRDEGRSQEDLVVQEDTQELPLSKNAAFIAVMVGILLFANWGRPDEARGFFYMVFENKWFITGILSLLFAGLLSVWFGVRPRNLFLAAIPPVALAFIFPEHHMLAFAAGAFGVAAAAVTGPDRTQEWLESSWGFAKQIMPLLFYGILAAGLLLGRPGHEALIPPEWVGSLVGGNSALSNLFASVVGAFMYFATLTEVPILQGLLGAGMGKGPALALLLAGPALSLPNMLVIRCVMGTKKTAVYVLLVVIMATVSGLIYGSVFA
jgi:hypothetical protein